MAVEPTCSLNRIARLLGGSPAGQEQDRVRSPIDGNEFTRYAEVLEEHFVNFDTKYAAPFVQWSRQNSAFVDYRGTVFYPFSGPDILYAYFLFPNAHTYVLCGREHCAPMLNAGRIESDLAGMRDRLMACVTHYLDNSYFLTKDLTQYADEECLGVLPIFLLFLARYGGEIVSTGAPSGADDCDSVEIVFRISGEEKKLIYFNCDLRDEYVSTSHSLYGQFGSDKKFATICKSSSYLLHEPNFSEVLEFIVSRSCLLVQDPSSVPFKIIRERGSQIELFGSYAGTLAVFDKYEQADLTSAFKTLMSSPLDFGFGYLTDFRRTALIAASFD